MKSIVCQNCLPDEYKDRAKELHGYWDVDREAGVARCNNCGYERPFHSRSRRNGMNPSQERAIERIRHFFRGWRDWDNAYKHESLYKFEIKPTDYGTYWVYVQDVEHTLIQRGGSFHIGPRGAIEVWSVSDLTDDKKRTAEHYAYMLDGKVSKYC